MKISLSSFDRIIRFCEELYADEFHEKIEELQTITDNIRKGLYSFRNPWDMECCFVPLQLPGGKYGVSPNADPEWVFQFSRLEWLINIPIMYACNGDATLMELWFNTVESFYEKNNRINNCMSAPKHSDKKLHIRIVKRIKKFFRQTQYPTYRTLDTAIRNYSLMSTIITTPLIANDHRSEKFVKRILEDSLWSFRELREFDLNSNWGIIILCSHIICKIISGTAANGLAEECDLLGKMLQRQLMPDGAHIESSFMYHNQVLIYLLRLVYWAKTYSYALPATISNAARSMARYTAAMIGPDGHQVQYGDSDDTELETLLSLSEAVLSGGDTIDVTTVPDLCLLYEFGFSPVIAPRAKHYSKKSVSLDGTICAVSGDFTLYVFNEPFHSGHKHADNGSFVLYFKHMALTVDSGRYTYSDPIWREYFKSPAAHSTLRILSGGVEKPADDISRSVCAPRTKMISENLSTTVCCEYKVGEYEIKRFFELRPSGLLIKDICCCPESRKALQTIIFNPDVKLSDENGTIQLSVDDHQFVISNDWSQKALEDCWVSPNYNMKKKSRKLVSFDSVRNGVVKTTSISMK